MHFATGRRVVSADREKRDVNVVVLADFAETGEVGAITAMKNIAAIHGKDKPAETAM